MFLSYQSRWPADVFAAPLMCAVGINLALMTDTLATCPDGTWQLWSIQVPHDPKTKIVVPVVRIPVVAIGRPAVLWIVVPRTAAHNTVQVYPLDANVKQYSVISAGFLTSRRSFGPIHWFFGKILDI